MEQRGLGVRLVSGVSEANNPVEDIEPPRKGRSNAILTYELMAGFDNKLTELVTRFDDFIRQRREADRDHQDHEVRLRTLEASMTAQTASKAASVGLGQWVWVALTVVIEIALHITSIVLSVKGGH